MTQTVALGASLGASKTGLLIGYRLLDLDGTTQVAFTRANVAESATIPGDWFVTVPVSISDDGAIVIWGISGTDYLQYTIDPVQPMTLADGAITDAKIADNAITDAKVASDVTIASVTGAVGSVTGNVGGNVAGSVASVVAGVALANNAVTAAAVANDAVAEIQSGLATSTALTTVADNVALILADTGTDGVVLSSATLNAIADALLKRSVSNVEATASTHSLAEIILAMLESSAPSTTWTIRKTDGTTFNTRTLTELAGAIPVVGVT